MEGEAPQRKMIIGGNWKCNSTKESVAELCAGLNAGSMPSDVEVVVSPPFLYLHQAKSLLDGSRFAVAAQNSGLNGVGAYTGETAPSMLVDNGIKWVVLGHSERRLVVARETDAEVGAKCRAALDAGLSVIACIGETLDQREDGSLWSVLDAQLDAIVANVGADWDRVVVAYEPVWAIGTGVVATPEQAQEVHAFLRKEMEDKVGKETAKATRIIYGGSVNAGNCSDLGKREDVDGFLVGGASLKAEDFLAICNAGHDRHGF